LIAKHEDFLPVKDVVRAEYPEARERHSDKSHREEEFLAETREYMRSLIAREIQ
jgi:hypothetical protein